MQQTRYSLITNVALAIAVIRIYRYAHTSHATIAAQRELKAFPQGLLCPGSSVDHRMTDRNVYDNTIYRMQLIPVQRQMQCLNSAIADAPKTHYSTIDGHSRNPTGEATDDSLQRRCIVWNIAS